MKLRLQAMLDLFRRYASVWRTAWSIREQFDTRPKLEYELAFQPAHLELTETPVHPAPRRVMHVIIALTLIVLLVMVVGRLDIVVTATGKLVPNARVKSSSRPLPASFGRSRYRTETGSRPASF